LDGEGGGGRRSEGVLLGAAPVLPGSDEPDAARDMALSLFSPAPLPSDVPEPSVKSTLPSTLVIGARLAAFLAGEGDWEKRRRTSATSFSLSPWTIA
jgi:hypothetical protein